MLMQNGEDHVTTIHGYEIFFLFPYYCDLKTKKHFVVKMFLRTQERANYRNAMLIWEVFNFDR